MKVTAINSSEATKALEAIENELSTHLTMVASIQMSGWNHG